MFVIDHCSDSHGYFPDLSPRSTLVVHSGDMLPNLATSASLVVPNNEVHYQRDWVKKRLDTFRDWLAGRPLIYTLGNHDFFDPEELFNKHGIKAVNVTGQVYNHSGLSFYGLPYIPYLQGYWNYELRDKEMAEKVLKIPTKGMDVLITHCPPYGFLDENTEGFFKGEHYGNTTLTNWLSYECEELPMFLLCGHIHDSHGIAKFDNMTVSNAATVVHTFEIEGCRAIKKGKTP